MGRELTGLLFDVRVRVKKSRYKCSEEKGKNEMKNNNKMVISEARGAQVSIHLDLKMWWAFLQ